MNLSAHIHTFGQWLLARHGQRVHKLALNVGFTCPNRDGSIGIGGCTFCNNVSFNPQGRSQPSIAQQIEAGRRVVRKRTGARRYLAYFQAYTNTYDELEALRRRYDEALREPDVIGLSIGTRPDCVPDAVLDLLAGYQARGIEIWLELGLQSAFDASLAAVNRGHGFAEYADALQRARQRGLPVCTHLILGLPGETQWHYRESLRRVLALGVDGLKLHPLHVVKGTALANQWRAGNYQPLTFDAYVKAASDLIVRTPRDVIFHRVTGTASRQILLAPAWCSEKWRVLNTIAKTVSEAGGQGASYRRSSGKPHVAV